jgi:two-component system nitrogen regulation response regulator NtrX
MARVLVVDDDAVALEIRKLVLERRGHQVSTAQDAAAARAATLPEVVVLDLRLPLLEDGLALVREFHEAGVRVVVLCGNPGDLDGREEAGMVDQMLAKPVKTEVLLKALE